MARAPVVCFGEILWDFLPDGLFPGGAPFNVGYHLHRHGVPTQVVSAVGGDILGDELLRRLEQWGLDINLIARHPHLRTGFVRARVGAGGDAHYEIVTDVAWDDIPATPEAQAAAARAGALIYGSLAQRSSANRTSLASLLAALPTGALRVFDVNLRPPHDDLALVRALALSASLLKLNHTEAAAILGETATPGQEESHARRLAADTRCPWVAITCGERGAGLWHAGRWHWEAGRAVRVADTVGSGDAFLAALVAHMLEGRLTPTESLARACRLGEWVATQRGATPTYVSPAPATSSGT